MPESEWPKANKRDRSRASSSHKLRVARALAQEAIEIVDRVKNDSGDKVGEKKKGE